MNEMLIPEGLSKEERRDFIINNPSIIDSISIKELYEFVGPFPLPGAFEPISMEQFEALQEAGEQLINDPSRKYHETCFRIFDEIEEEKIRAALNRAISNGDEKRIDACIESLDRIGKSVTNEELKKIRSYRKQKVLKSGPKPIEVFDQMHIVSNYKVMCSDREMAKVSLNSHKKEFELITDTITIGEDRKKIFQWKYPELDSMRAKTKLPTKKDIKDYICEVFEIGDRTFDSLLATYNNRMSISLFNLLCHRGIELELAKKATCRSLNVRLRDLERWLVIQKS